MQNFGQILFVMWRESVEAMLVIGILHAWLSHNALARRGLLYLWGGVLAGIGGAFVLGLGIEAMNAVLSDEGQDYFQAGLMLTAAALIVQMVFWMRRHGRTLKKDMERSLRMSTRHQHWWGVFSLAAIAVAREGSETVVFLSSLAMAPQGIASAQFWMALLGFNGSMPRGEMPVRGQGSGFIVAKDGLILTNAHVVRDADEVMVKLTDRREYKAKVLGVDTATDVAVLKINADNLPVVSLGNPGKLSVGDYVLAIGSPFGFEQSATAGIVSAKGRSLPGDGYVPFIQTDVAVNPGNSGGPLFDANGNVVGINSQIYSQTGGYQGVSFAIPIDVALHVQDQIVKTGKVVHARLGVTVQELNQTLANSFKLDQPDGALVSSVMPGSAAAKAGVEPGDVILQYNGQKITRSGDLPALVGLSKPGEQANLEVWRGGKKLNLSAPLTAAKDESEAEDTRLSGRTPQARLGVAVRPLSPEERRAANVASGGVLVEQTTGAAARAGIEEGDVILAVNGTTVKSPEQLQSLISKDSGHVALLIQRGESKIFVPVTLG